MQVVYEDNHVIIVTKESGEIVQGDKTGDTPLSETVKAYIKEKYQKPVRYSWVLSTVWTVLWRDW